MPSGAVSIAGCITHTDCGSGQYCSSGLCVKGEAPPSEGAGDAGEPSEGPDEPLTADETPPEDPADLPETPADQCVAQAEVCNGKDDDCDGMIDNNVVELGGTCTVNGQQGSCQKGVISACNAGQLECKGNQPTAEVCDGEDNDCNGMVDDTFPEKGQACQLPDKEGACRQGTYTQCLQGALICEGPSSAQEMCDGIDNDCDGSVDEEFPELGTTCTINGQKGPCAQGSTICTSGKIDCQQINMPTTEKCGNGIDEDCDGQADETPPCACDASKTPTQACFSGALSQKGVGICAEGTQSCVNGQWGTCMGEVLPTSELCNNKDDDCNGTVDDVTYTSSTCQVQPSTLQAYQRCLSGNKKCASGQELCELPLPKTETLLSQKGLSEGKLGPCSQATIGEPFGLALATNGDLYVSSALKHQIYKIEATTGKVSLLAGSGNNGFKDDTDGTKAQFNTPRGMAFDDQGNLYVADAGNHAIRKITPAGVVTTLAGGQRSNKDGSGTAAGFNQPHDMTWNGKDQLLYVADTDNHRIRAITLAGNVATITGTAAGFVEGSAAIARFRNPRGILYDAKNDALLVADTGNHCIRRVDLTLPVRPTVTYLGNCTKAGDEDLSLALAKFDSPVGLFIDANGDLLVADQGNHTIRLAELSKGVFGKVPHVAGVKGKVGFGNLGLTDSKLNKPAHVVVNAKGEYYIADELNAQIRLRRDVVLRTYAGVSGQSTFKAGDRLCARIDRPSMVAFHPTEKALYISDSNKHVIYRLNPRTNYLEIFSGSGTAGYADDSRGSAEWSAPYGIAIDSKGAMFVADRDNHCIRKIDALGVVSTYAGKCETADNKDAPSAEDARFLSPVGLAFDASDNLYVTDNGKCVRRIASGGGAVSTVAGTCDTAGSATGPARNPTSGTLRSLFTGLRGIVVDSDGILGTKDAIYIADEIEHVIRKIVPVTNATCAQQASYTGFCIQSVAGTAGISGNADGSWINALFSKPFGLFLSRPLASLLVTDGQNHRLRRIDDQGNVVTLSGTTRGSADGLDSAAQFDEPMGITADDLGNLYVIDYDNQLIRVLPACP